MVLLHSCAFHHHLVSCHPSLSASQGGGESRYQVTDPGDEDTKRVFFWALNKGSLFLLGKGKMDNPRIFFRENTMLVGDITVFHLARLVGVLEILLMATRNPVNSPVEVGSVSHYIHGFLDPRWWSPEFFHQQYQQISCVILQCNIQKNQRPWSLMVRYIFVRNSYEGFEKKKQIMKLNCSGPCVGFLGCRLDTIMGPKCLLTFVSWYFRQVILLWWQF